MTSLIPVGPSISTKRHVEAQIYADEYLPSEITELEGTWYTASAMISGCEAPIIQGQYITFHDNHFEIVKKGWRRFGGTFSINPKLRPATINFIQTDSEFLRGVWKGIYRLDSNILTLCDNAPERSFPRPTHVRQGQSSGYVTTHSVRCN